MNRHDRSHANRGNGINDPSAHGEVIDISCGEQPARLRASKLKRETCPDCTALEGWLHKSGCDLERCRCGRQVASCDCADRFKTSNRVPFIDFSPRCAKCGEVQGWDDMFMAPNDEWDRYVIRPGGRDRILCRSCYDQIKAWIDEYEGADEDPNLHFTR
jgi:hypothetical protein